MPTGVPSIPSNPYSTARAAYNEARDGSGELRTHWKSFSELLNSPSGSDELASRNESLRRHLEELGVTYNVYADAQGQERPWQLDLFPLVIAHEEWAFLERGLAQRTRLLNALLRDIYGPQRLIAEGLLPAELVLGHPYFLRPCMGQQSPRDLPLVLHAVNLARDPNGIWRAISDRTQTPSGLGYALANRIVLSRTLPEHFRSSQVQRHAAFFMAFREALRSLAPKGVDAPSIALLTPGPFNETYFEHSFLARYLGFNLVEGGDLTVREQRVFIKTLEGLRGVDVLLRRVDDAFCDPLELKTDSCLGVPGLLGATRSGLVSVVNSIGCAWLESPALHAFLPQICQQLLGETLLIPGVDTEWCGMPDAAQRVRDHLDDYVLKRTHGASMGTHIFGGRLNAEAREALLRELAFDPGAFVAQHHLPLSRVPTYISSAVDHGPVVLRAFVCASPTGCSVLPGGLSRVPTKGDRMIVSMQAGGVSKDTWVLSDKPVSQVSLLRPATQVIRLERAPSEVPSRVADNLFWLGRYAERLEDTSRVLRSLLQRLNNEASLEETPELTAMVHLLVKLDLLDERQLTRRTLAGLERECVQLIYRSHRLGTIREVHSRLQTLAFSLRDRFSSDTQRILNRLQHSLRTPSEEHEPASAGLEVLNHAILHLAALSGLEMENMTRGHAWRFLDMGRRLERAINIVTLLQSGLLSKPPDPLSSLPPILEIADSSMTYRRRYFGQPHWSTVVDLLIADESNPRSFAFQVGALLDHVQKLPGAQGRSPSATPEARQLNALKKSLAQLNLAELSEEGEAPSSELLPGTLERLAEEMRLVSNSITQRFFTQTALRPH